MNFKWKSYFKVLFLLAFVFFYCEFIIYYLIIYQCSWPDLQSGHNQSIVKSMILADTHLLGPFRGHWFDKLRREWQMHRSFQSAVSIHEPDVVFILGDLFDEGQWCDESAFLEYVDRFLSLFKVPKNIKLFVVPGNHDLGFHYALKPYLLYKFQEIFNCSSVQFLNLRGNYFILINSMAMEGDGCYLCMEAEKSIKKLARELKCLKSGKCINRLGLKKYSRPIVLQHFPMFRQSDSECNEIDEAPPEIKNNLFKEKWDCLSADVSEMIYNELNPRAIFTGHVHHGCHTIHRGDIHEYTTSSFSWRNKNNPTFTLAKIAPNKYSIRKCHLPRETTVIFIYSSAVLGSLMWFILDIKKKLKRF